MGIVAYFHFSSIEALVNALKIRQDILLQKDVFKILQGKMTYWTEHWECCL